MYNYEKIIPLNKEEILKRVSQKDIFGIFIKENICIGKTYTYKALYRKDNNPMCYFEEYNNILYFVDFAYSNYPIDCFNFIKLVLKTSFFETLLYINDYFKLGLGVNSNNIPIKPTIYEDIDNHIKNVQKKPLKIYFKPRGFNYKDKNFWSKYGISKYNLIEDKVFPIEVFTIMKDSNNINIFRPVDITYAYTDFNDANILNYIINKEIPKIKIYKPENNKFKWITNCSNNDIGALSKIDYNKDYLIITKSYKDFRVLKNQNYNTIWFQNEGMLPSKEILLKILKPFKTIYIFFDNDNTGLSKSLYVKQELLKIFPVKVIKCVFIPPILLKEGIKDPSDFIASKGMFELKNLLNKLIV